MFRPSSLATLTRCFSVVVLTLGCGTAAAVANPTNNALIVPLEPPRVLYTVDCTVEIDSNAAAISGTEAISLTNTTGMALEKLALEWPNDSLHEIELTVNGHPVDLLFPPDSLGASAPTIISLPKPVESGQELEMVARFQRRYAFEPGDSTHLWTNWHPKIDWGAPTQSDYVVRIDYPSAYVFASSGAYDSVTESYRAIGCRQYGLYFAKGAMTLQRQAGDVAVRVVHPPAGVECAQLIMETAVDVVNFYRERFGLYPSDHIAIVPGANNPVGGYPAATSLVVIHGMEQMSQRDTLHWQWITAHEIGHQYWLEHVLPQPNDQWGWLMIGLGIYVDREYTRARELPADRHHGLMNRYRDGVREGLDTRADVHGSYLEDIDFDFNNVVVHGKGYSIISALDCLLGDSLFNVIHNRCLHEFAGRRMGFYDFQTVCEQETGQDLDWFFDQWVRSSPYLSYEIVSQECEPGDDGYHTVVQVERLGSLDMPVPVTAYFADSTSQTVFTTRLQPVSTIRFYSHARLADAVIDAEGELALVIPPPTEEELTTRRVLTAIPHAADIAALPELTARALAMDIEQTLFWGQLGRKLYDWELYEEALAVFERRAQLLADIESEWIASAYGWQGLLLDLLKRRDEAVEAYQRALGVEFERDFAYDGDPVTISREWLQERLTTPYQRQ